MQMFVLVILVKNILHLSNSLNLFYRTNYYGLCDTMIENYVIWHGNHISTTNNYSINRYASRNGNKQVVDVHV